MATALRFFAPALTWLCAFLWMLALAFSVNLMVDDFLQCRGFVQDTPPPPPPTARLDRSTLATRLGLSVPWPPRAGFSYVIRKQGPALYELSPDVVRGFAVELTCANSLLHVSRTYKAGVFQGFELSFPPRESSYVQMGLRDQDILRSVNGRALDGFEITAEFLALLRNPPPRLEVQLELERDGKRLRRTYRVK